MRNVLFFLASFATLTPFACGRSSTSSNPSAPSASSSGGAEAPKTADSAWCRTMADHLVEIGKAELAKGLTSPDCAKLPKIQQDMLADSGDMLKSVSDDVVKMCAKNAHPYDPKTATCFLAAKTKDAASACFRATKSGDCAATFCLSVPALGDVCSQTLATDQTLPEVAPLMPDADPHVKTFCDETFGALHRVQAEISKQCKTKPSSGTDFDSIFTTKCKDVLLTSSAKKRIRFDDKASEACVSKVEAAIADVEKHGAAAVHATIAGPDCDTVITGLQSEGAPCSDDFECEAKLTCVDASNAKDGTCKKGGPAGATCGRDPKASGGIYVDLGLGDHPRCAANAACEYSLSDHRSMCEARAAVGGACIHDADCNDGLSCVSQKCAAKRVAVGGTCLYDDDCAGDAICRRAHFGKPGVCAAKLKDGATCDASLESDECDGSCVDGRCVTCFHGIPRGKTAQ